MPGEGGAPGVAPSAISQENQGMATQPIAEPLVSLEEYLNSDFQPDREFNDGVIEERNLGEFDHAFLQTMLATLFNNHMGDWGVFALAETRIQLNPKRCLIPDVAVMRMGIRREPVLSGPPLIAIEVMSTGDRLRKAERKAQEYLDFGVENVWVIEPGGKRKRAVYRGTRSGLELVPSGELAVAGTPILVDVQAIFNQLDGF
jgi:Uma2 family endonuclease